MASFGAGTREQGLPPEIMNLLANGEISPEALKMIQALARNPGLIRKGPPFRDIMFEKAMKGVDLGTEY